MRLYVLFFTIILSIFILGCGYKPAINYTKKALSGSVYTSLDFSTNDGRDSAYLKEYINRILLRRFHTKIVNKKELSDIILKIKLDKISQKALQTDKSGYARIYKVTVKATIKYFKNFKGSKVYTLHLKNYSTYVVNDDSTINTDNKQLAIRKSIDRILESFISSITIQNI